MSATTLLALTDDLHRLLGQPVDTSRPMPDAGAPIGERWERLDIPWDLAPTAHALVTDSGLRPQEDTCSWMRLTVSHHGLSLSTRPPAREIGLETADAALTVEQAIRTGQRLAPGYAALPPHVHDLRTALTQYGHHTASAIGEHAAAQHRGGPFGHRRASTRITDTLAALILGNAGIDPADPCDPDDIVNVTFTCTLTLMHTPELLDVARGLETGAVARPRTITTAAGTPGRSVT